MMPYRPNRSSYLDTSPKHASEAPSPNGAPLRGPTHLFLRYVLRMGFIDVGNARIACRSFGNGPALLAPECNYSWTREIEERMSRRFTVIAASPRDFGQSTRTHGPYRPQLWATDLLAAARHFGHDHVLYFGYSFTGAFGPWLALKLQEHGTLRAVASGGFPLLGDYTVTAGGVNAQLAQLEADPEAFSEWDRRFDPRAGAAFYDDLATLAPDSLVDTIPCPLYSFWGDRDDEAVGAVMPHSELAAGLARRGVTWKEYAGYDHEGLMQDLCVAWPEVETWLLDQVATVGA
jgi:pimeloyl-ACP methyl ester carboxylesterase